jgi:N12 class adenine-specific DNA methylase
LRGWLFRSLGYSDSEFLDLYPQARLFVASSEHFAAGNRERAMARIASGNYDAVIVSHRSFEFLPTKMNRIAGLPNSDITAPSTCS